MLKIRFQRTGRRNDPSFRVVVGEHQKHPKSGKQVQIVGSYHPKTKETKLDEEAIKGWIEKGAQTSGTVHNLLVSKGIIEGEKVNVLPKKTPIVKEEEPKDEKAEVPTEGEDAQTEDTPAEEDKAEESTEEETSKEEKQEEPVEEKKEQKEENSEEDKKAS